MSEETVFNGKKRKMVEALNKSLGIVTHAAKLAGIDRGSHYKWVKSDPDYKQAWIESKRGAIDLAESTLHKEMKEGGKGAVTASIFLLKTLGKEDGYVERKEHTITKPEPGEWFDDSKSG